MGARGTGLKKDTHTVKASNPGEPPASPEVSEKKTGTTQIAYLLYFTNKNIRFFEI